MPKSAALPVVGAFGDRTTSTDSVPAAGAESSSVIVTVSPSSALADAAANEAPANDSAIVRSKLSAPPSVRPPWAFWSASRTSSSGSATPSATTGIVTVAEVWFGANVTVCVWYGPSLSAGVPRSAAWPVVGAPVTRTTSTDSPPAAPSESVIVSVIASPSTASTETVAPLSVWAGSAPPVAVNAARGPEAATVRPNVEGAAAMAPDAFWSVNVNDSWASVSPSSVTVTVVEAVVAPAANVRVCVV